MRTYMLIFLGLLVGGESVLIPAVYLTFIHVLSAPTLIVLSICATVISDTFWYIMGRRITHERISNSTMLKRYHKGIETAGRLVRTYGIPFLIISKFVYGTRTAMQVLAGLERIPYAIYMIVNMIGIGLYTGTIFGLAYLVRESLEQFKLTVIAFQVSFGLLFLLTASILLWVNYKMSKRWFQ
ncbi:MAG TPA: VTT domain-containing protein [Candidatus Kapabacteria bacterium]|nr:VTT domain-containing protein [Candidatus Kapabacteria bacterium]